MNKSASPAQKLGICDKGQYEHHGPHKEIPELGQSMPPFACRNWKPIEEPIVASPAQLCAEIMYEDHACGQPKEHLVHINKHRSYYHKFSPIASPAQISDEPKERYILIGTGEGAYSAVVDNLRDGLHGFMCFCGQSLVACKHEDTLEMLKEMENDDNWSVDESGRRHQYSFEGYCYGISVTILRSRLEPVEAPKDEPYNPLEKCQCCHARCHHFSTPDGERGCSVCACSGFFSEPVEAVSPEGK